MQFWIQIHLCDLKQRLYAGSEFEEDAEVCPCVDCARDPRPDRELTTEFFKCVLLHNG